MYYHALSNKKQRFISPPRSAPEEHMNMLFQTASNLLMEEFNLRSFYTRAAKALYNDVVVHYY